MTNIEDIQISSISSGSLHICGIAPRVRLTTRQYIDCYNCERKTLGARRFSGSVWYDDDLICTRCGENMTTGYRPFKPAWRKENIAKAKSWIAEAVPRKEFRNMTQAAIKNEMDWSDE